MKKEEIFEGWEKWIRAIEEGTAILLCESCKKFKKMTKTSQITIRICDECMGGVSIPTF